MYNLFSYSGSVKHCVDESCAFSHNFVGAIIVVRALGVLILRGQCKTLETIQRVYRGGGLQFLQL